MRITTAWMWDGTMDGPELVASFDELTEDAWNGTPDFFTEAVDKYDAPIRVAVVDVPSSAIYGLFDEPTIAGSVTAMSPGETP